VTWAPDDCYASDIGMECLDAQVDARQGQSGHNQLFMPVVQEAKKLIDSGAIGRVLWLRSQDCFRAGGEGGTVE